MSKLDSQISVLIMSERWGDLKFLMDQIKIGIEIATKESDDDDLTAEEKEEDQNNKMLALFGWFLLLSQLFTATQDYGIPDEVLPGADFYDPIIRAMADSNEEVFLLACEACLAMNIHYSERSSNQFMKALMAADDNQHFGEALTWILNKQSAPYSNGPLLKQSLKSLQDLFSGAFFFCLFSSAPFLFVVFTFCYNFPFFSFLTPQLTSLFFFPFHFFSSPFSFYFPFSCCCSCWYPRRLVLWIFLHERLESVSRHYHS
jgi:hypothetical protein